MTEENKFYKLMSKAWDEFRDVERSKAYWEKVADSRKEEITNLYGALKRAQEMIDMLSESLPDGELKKDAKIYAAVISGIVGDRTGKPFPHYSDNTLIQKYWEDITKRVNGEKK